MSRLVGSTDPGCRGSRLCESGNALFVADLLAVALHLRHKLYVLPRLDDCKSMAESPGLDDRCMVHTLIFAEEVIGKRATYRSNLKLGPPTFHPNYAWSLDPRGEGWRILLPDSSSSSLSLLKYSIASESLRPKE